MDLTKKEMIKLLRRARYEAEVSGKEIIVKYPAYRNDIMHQRDVVEDIAISFGLNHIPPEPPKLPTMGAEDPKEEFSNVVRELMVGLGFQEVLTFSLTDKNNLFKKMNLKEGRVCEIANPISTNWNVLRNWLLPSMLEFLSNNLHVDYPQEIFEVGDVVELDAESETKTKTIRKLACVIADTRVSYEEISSALDAVLRNLGMEYRLKRSMHASFIPGRVAEVIHNNNSIGVIGEIHPKVLNNWKLEKPVAGFELKL